jgi:hypothetical protein
LCLDKGDRSGEEELIQASIDRNACHADLAAREPLDLRASFPGSNIAPNRAHPVFAEPDNSGRRAERISLVQGRSLASEIAGGVTEEELSLGLSGLARRVLSRWDRLAQEGE